MHQTKYSYKIYPLPSASYFMAFRSLCHRLAWLYHTRPDIFTVVNKMSQVTEEDFSATYIKLANSNVRRARSDQIRGTLQKKLEKNSLRLVVYVDSSFQNNKDYTTQLRYIVLLAEDIRRENWLHFCSYKSKRFVRSVLGAEIYTFVDAFGFAYLLRHDLEDMLKGKLPLTILTDSEILFKKIFNATITTEKRLLIDFKVAREAYQKGDISNVGWLRSERNIPDGMTKLE